MPRLRQEEENKMELNKLEKRMVNLPGDEQTRRHEKAERRERKEIFVCRKRRGEKRRNRSIPTIFRGEYSHDLENDFVDLSEI